MMKQSRLDQLADSIFAITLTILVFGMQVPEYTGVITENSLINSLLNMYPVFLSYLLSFSLIFTYWKSHHFIASVLAKNINSKFANLNGIFFFLLGLVPFSSHFLGKNIHAQTPIIFFAINIILIGISLFNMRNYAIKSHTIENAPFTKEEDGHAKAHIVFPIISAILAIILSFVDTNLALILFTLAILFNLSKNGTKYIFLFLNIFQHTKKETAI